MDLPGAGERFPRSRATGLAAPPARARPAPHVLPELEPTAECIRVVAEARALGQGVEEFRVAAPKHDIVRLEGLQKLGHDLRDGASPFLLPEAFEAAETHVVLVRLSLLEREMGDLH